MTVHGKDSSLIEMTMSEFISIPEDSDYPMEEYFYALVGHQDVFLERFEVSEDEVTRGQRALYVIGIFDSQVKNGGIIQFLWNRPDLIFSVGDAISDLDQGPLLVMYDRVIETLMGPGDWRLDRQWSSLGRERMNLEPYPDGRDLLKLDWFDDAYLDKGLYDEAGNWMIRPGIHRILIAALLAYVRANPAQFIRDPDETGVK